MRYEKDGNTKQQIYVNTGYFYWKPQERKQKELFLPSEFIGNLSPTCKNLQTFHLHFMRLLPPLFRVPYVLTTCKSHLAFKNMQLY